MASDTDEGQWASVQGLRLLQRVEPLLERLRPAACQRDRAGNRKLFYDQLCSLILLTFFNPTFKTLGDLRKASRLAAVRKKLGCSRTSMGSLSEAMRVFDPALLGEIVQDLLGQIPQSPTADPRLKSLAHIPTAVDGSLLRQLPQVTQACFALRKDRGWKLHAHFEVLRGIPTFARVTNATNKGDAGENAVLKTSLQPDRCYLLDRGYVEFALFNAIVAAQSSYVCRGRNDDHFRAETTRELTAEAESAGVLEDRVGRMGSPKSKRIEHPDHTQRRIVVRFTPHPKRGGRRRAAASQNIVLVTNLLDVPAEIVALLYRFRWLIELFFRWLKCVLDCRHLLSEDARGIQIQMHCALIACLLIQLICPFKPDQWTYKLLCLYLQGWATEEELIDYLRERASQRKRPE